MAPSRDIHPAEEKDYSYGLQLQENMNNQILDIKTAVKGAVVQLNAGMCELTIEYLSSQGFTWIQTPRLIDTNIEGDNEFFSVPYFGETAFLAQTTQFHAQMALGVGLKRVFEIGPLFRAEKRVSTRHLTEFTGLDVEMNIVRDHQEIIDVALSLLEFIVTSLQKREKFRNLVAIFTTLYSTAGSFQVGRGSDGKIPKITFKEAKAILRDRCGMKVDDNENFTAEEEAALGLLFRDSPEFGNTDLFAIEGYPSHMRAFYSAPEPTSPGIAKAFDIILRGQEVVSGSQHINSYTELRQAMENHSPPLDPDADKWKNYLATFKAGVPPHGGFGMGMNRVLQGFLGMKDVKEATFFPSNRLNLAP